MNIGVDLNISKETFIEFSAPRLPKLGINNGWYSFIFWIRKDWFEDINQTLEAYEMDAVFSSKFINRISAPFKTVVLSQ
jgi:hypothetical protein